MEQSLSAIATAYCSIRCRVSGSKSDGVGVAHEDRRAFALQRKMLVGAEERECGGDPRQGFEGSSRAHGDFADQRELRDACIRDDATRNIRTFGPRDGSEYLARDQQRNGTERISERRR